MCQIIEVGGYFQISEAIQTIIALFLSSGSITD